MSIVSTARSSKQHIGGISLKKKYASEEQTQAIGRCIHLLREAGNARTESEYFLRLSDALKEIRKLGAEIVK